MSNVVGNCSNGHSIEMCSSLDPYTTLVATSHHVKEYKHHYLTISSGISWNSTLVLIFTEIETNVHGLR